MMSASDMEMDEGTEQSLLRFANENDLDVSIVPKLKEAKSAIHSRKIDEKNRAGILVGCLLSTHGNFTEDHAKEALKILFPEPEEPKSNHRGPSIVDGLHTTLAHTFDLGSG